MYTYHLRDFEVVEYPLKFRSYDSYLLLKLEHAQLT